MQDGVHSGVLFWAVLVMQMQEEDKEVSQLKEICKRTRALVYGIQAQVKNCRRQEYLTTQFNICVLNCQKLNWKC